MKNTIRLLMLAVFVFSGDYVFGQEVTLNDTVYKVENGEIFSGNKNVTKTAKPEIREKILFAIEHQNDKFQEAKRIEKQLEKAEKERKREEKKRKQVEKKLKQKQKAQANLEHAIKRHENALKKYNKLKSKGKLSPVKEANWLDKIERLDQSIGKAKLKLK